MDSKTFSIPYIWDNMPIKQLKSPSYLSEASLDMVFQPLLHYHNLSPEDINYYHCTKFTNAIRETVSWTVLPGDTSIHTLDLKHGYVLVLPNFKRPSITFPVPYVSIDAFDEDAAQLLVSLRASPVALSSSSSNLSSNDQSENHDKASIPKLPQPPRPFLPADSIIPETTKRSKTSEVSKGTSVKQTKQVQSQKKDEPSKPTSTSSKKKEKGKRKRNSDTNGTHYGKCFDYEKTELKERDILDNVYIQELLPPSHLASSFVNYVFDSKAGQSYPITPSFYQLCQGTRKLFLLVNQNASSDVNILIAGRSLSIDGGMNLVGSPGSLSNYLDFIMNNEEFVQRYNFKSHVGLYKFPTFWGDMVSRTNCTCLTLTGLEALLDYFTNWEEYYHGTNANRLKTFDGEDLDFLQEAIRFLGMLQMYL